jgi:hypothetical protein
MDSVAGNDAETQGTRLYRLDSPLAAVHVDLQDGHRGRCSSPVRDTPDSECNVTLLSSDVDAIHCTSASGRYWIFRTSRGACASFHDLATFVHGRHLAPLTRLAMHRATSASDCRSATLSMPYFHLCPPNVSRSTATCQSLSTPHRPSFGTSVWLWELLQDHAFPVTLA